MFADLGQRLYHAVAAYRDYRHARGFRHKKELSNLCASLDDAIGDIESEQEKRRQSIKKQRTYILDDARTKASKALLREELTSVRGIGDTLATRIRRHRHITDLSSLRRHAGRVKGVGQDKASALDWWAQQQSKVVEERAEQMAEESDQYEHRRTEMKNLRSQIEELEEEKNHLQGLKGQLEGVLSTLESVSPKTLYRARLNGEPEDIDFATIDRYFRGAYGQWETPPDWLKEIQEVVSGA